MIRASGVPFAFLRMNLFLEELPLWFDPRRLPWAGRRRPRLADHARRHGRRLGGGGEGARATRARRSTSRARSRTRCAARGDLQRARRPPLRYEPGTRGAWLEGRLAAGVPAWDANIGVRVVRRAGRRRVRRHLRCRPAGRRRSTGVRARVNCSEPRALRAARHRRSPGAQTALVAESASAHGRRRAIRYVESRAVRSHCCECGSAAGAP